MTWDGLDKANATRILQLLHNRTVVVLGDSHALDLWCGLVCWFATTGGAQLGRLSVKPPLSGSWVLTMDLPPFKTHWQVPLCASGDGKGQCGQGTHCGTLRKGSCLPGCGHNLFQQLLHKPERLFVLWSPCAQYAAAGKLHSGMMLRSGLKLERFRQLGTDPLAAICPAICPNMANTTIHSYAQVARRAAYGLRALHKSSSSSGGALVQALPAHFPEVEGMLTPWHAQRLDGLGSYDRLVASGLLWLHRQLANNDTEALLQMGVDTLEHAEPSLLLGTSRMLETFKCDRSASQSCLLQLVRSIGGGPGGLRHHLRAARCAPLPDAEVDRPLLAATTPPDWRQRIETAAALEANVPLLASYVSRRRRWDLHPGIQGGHPSQRSSKYDCSHSVIAADAYVTEVIWLQRALESTFGDLAEELRLTGYI